MGFSNKRAAAYVPTKNRPFGVLRAGLRYGLLFTLMLCGSGHVYGYGAIEKVSTSSLPDGAVIEVTVSGYSGYKVIPVGKTEVLIAFKDTHVSDDVYTHEAIVGDQWIKEIEVIQRPFDVASLVLKLHRPDLVVDLEEETANEVFRIHVKPKIPSFDKSSADPFSGGSIGLGESPEDRPEGRPEGREDHEDRVSVSEKEASPDDKLFRQAVKCQKKGEWDRAIAAYDKIIRAYPRSRHLETSYFRVADVVYNKHKDNISRHLIEVSERYRLATSRFPGSDHIPRALLSWGDAYVQAGQYFEAVTYYERVLERDTANDIVAEALFNKGKVLALTQRPLMALRAFEKVIQAYGATAFAGRAKLETAKTLHEMKSFKRSLRILDELASEFPAMVYRNADVLLYTAYNHYELGRLEKAREAFSKAVNYFPEVEERDLILARIADTFREEGFEEKAAKIYSLVARTYPGSEAGVISLLRLAEIAEAQEEKSPLQLKEDVASENSSKTAGEIYREIISEYPDSPLARVAMLKLASLQKRRKEYGKCVETLKDLLTKHPETKLKDQVEKVMLQAMIQMAVEHREKGNHEQSVNTMATILEEHPETRFGGDVLQGMESSLVHVLRTKKDLEGAEGVVTYYEEREDLISPARMPEASAIVGMAYKELYLCDHAIPLLSAARKSYADRDIPPDYLLGLGECGYREGRYDLATEALAAFISTYPQHAEIAKARLWLGEVFISNADYDEALRVLKRGLEETKPSEGPRVDLLVAMGKALKGKGDYRKAISSLNQALDTLEPSADNRDTEVRFAVYKALGETYCKVGESEKAVEAFDRALTVKPEEINPYGLKFEIAKYYRSIAPGKAQELLNEIVASGDPFWSKVAQARINEINVEESVGRLGLNRS